METDFTLLSRYHRDGDAGAFQALVRAHAGMVFAVARRITRDATLAEEVAQDTFLALARRGQAVRESVGAWLHHVARQKALNAVRAESRRQRYEQAAAEVLVGEQDESWAEIEPVVDEVIDGLPNAQQSLLIEHFLEQCTQQELARRLGLSQSTVSRQIEAALQMLRDGLKQKGVMCGVGLAGLLKVNSAPPAPTTLTVTLNKIGMTGVRSGAAGSAMTWRIFFNMTTRTKAAMAIAVIAATTAPFLVHRKSAPSVSLVRPKQGDLVLAKPPGLKPAEEPRREIPTLDQVWDEAMAVPDDRQLILAEFKRRGATIKQKLLDDDINAIIREEFGNNQAAFERRLREKDGLTLEQFRTQRREDIIIIAMKGMVTQGVTDPAAKKREVDEWLAELRRKAGVIQSKSGASAGAD